MENFIQQTIDDFGSLKNLKNSENVIPLIGVLFGEIDPKKFTTTNLGISVCTRRPGDPVGNI